MKKQYTYLVGPFIGELLWEYFYFAPHIIYLKKTNDNVKIIVCTRSDRFDLYGQYVDILIPVKIKNDIKENHYCFKLKKINLKYYNKLINSYYNKYKKDKSLSIVKHIYPNISSFYYKFKWQFSKLTMDYDFKPRKNNKIIVKKYVKKSDILLSLSEKKYKNENIKLINELSLKFKNNIDDNSSLIGCFIESIKLSKGVIGYLDNNISRLSLLLNKPLYILDDDINIDKINLINPYKTKVTKINSVDEGIELLL
jgi:hypothetical protein